MVVQLIFLVTIAFWAMGILDLISYYISMEFPMEKFLIKYRKMKMMNVWRVMWILVLFQIYMLVAYIILSLLWFIIGAIVKIIKF